MGISASSLLDETKANYIKGEAEAELKQFSPLYRKQFSVAYISQVQDELEQQQEQITQLLQQREAPEVGEVLYEEGVFFFDETRKWRERYIVVRANYCLECHDSFESFVKGAPPRQKLLPTGGTVLTTEERYMSMVDKCFPDSANNVKEDFAPPLAGMPGQFPVYLRLPYRRDSYFCFRQESKQAGFLSILWDCIRHQNHDFLKRKTCEVQAFLKTVQLYRQEQGSYEPWDMLIGSDARVMANLVMEKLLPSLEKDILPRLKAKKTERKRVWFATMEAAYILIQEQLLEGLTALKDECRITARQQEVLMHSDMDQINSSRALLQSKIRDIVSEPAEKFCAENIQPYLASVLEELMEPISLGFQEARQLSDSMMGQLCKDFQVGGVTDDLRKALAKLSKPDLHSCYQRIGSLQEKLTQLQGRFCYSSTTSLVHSTQIDLQQLMQNAAFTFEQLVHKAVQDNPDHAGPAMEKAKQRVLKQYDYDSSTMRKRIFQEALVSITLPHIKKNLAPTCKPKLQELDQFIFADHSNFIHVENVYEGILLQMLDKDVTKVVKEAASDQRHNLFSDSRDLLSQSSRSSLSSPSSPGSPSRPPASPTPSSSEPQARLPSSPLSNGVPASPQETSGAAQEEERQEELNSEAPVAVETKVPDASVLAPAEEVVEKAEEAEAIVSAAEQTMEAETVEDKTQVITEILAPAETETEAELAETEIIAPASSEAVSREEPEITEEAMVETAAEAEMPKTDTLEVKMDVEEATEPQSEPSVLSPGPKVPEPEVPEPEVPEPDVPGPTVQEPEVPEPTVTEPDVPGPTVPEPEVPEPTVTEFAVPEPEVPEPTVTEPAVPEPDVPEPTVPEPEVTEPVVQQVTEPVVPEAEVQDLAVQQASEETLTGSIEEPLSLTPAATSAGEAAMACNSPVIEVETPSSGTEAVITPADGSAKAEDAGKLPQSFPSDGESVEPQETQSSDDEVSATSDLAEDDARVSESPVSSDEAPAEAMEESTETTITTSDSLSPQTPPENINSDAGTGEGAEATVDANANVEPEAALTEEASAPPQPTTEAPPAEQPTVLASPPPDCIKGIRDLVVEVIEVEELVQRYPSGVPKVEDE